MKVNEKVLTFSCLINAIAFTVSKASALDGVREYFVNYSHPYIEPGISARSVQECMNNQTCITTFTPNLETAMEYNYTDIVHAPYCQLGNASRSMNFALETGFCRCEENYCRSKGMTQDEEVFYYCGPCRRLGSECTGSVDCDYDIAECIDGFCECKSEGNFFDLYICYVPYYGYELAVQMAILTCIIIALCLLIASLYNAIGFRRLRHVDPLRNFLRRNSGVRESPPNDTPPKYEDIIEELPTYQEALGMEMRTQEGIENPGFDFGSEVQSPSETSKIDENSKEETPAELGLLECPKYSSIEEIFVPDNADTQVDVEGRILSTTWMDAESGRSHNTQ